MKTSFQLSVVISILFALGCNQSDVVEPVFHDTTPELVPLDTLDVQAVLDTDDTQSFPPDQVDPEPDSLVPEGKRGEGR